MVKRMDEEHFVSVFVCVCVCKLREKRNVKEILWSLVTLDNFGANFFIFIKFLSTQSLS
jgi:hypothetical protein